MKKNIYRYLNYLIFALITILGLVAFLYPFFLPIYQKNVPMGSEHSPDATLVAFLLVILIITMIYANFNSGNINSKLVSFLGVLIGIDVILRLVPSIMGFSAIFFLMILVGYVFGGTSGFIIGSLSLLVSSLFLGQIGPWLPFQMLAAGWMGASGALIPRLKGKKEIIVLSLWGLLCGYVYGLIMNIWFWPYLSGGSMYYEEGMHLLEILKRYFVFYFATSFIYDTFRAVGNFLLLLILGIPLLKIFTRYRKKFFWEYQISDNRLQTKD